LKTVLVTGGTGSLGTRIVKRLIKDKVDKIIVFSRDEQKQALMERALKKDVVEYVIGDIRDISSLEKVFKVNKIDTVIHTAAMKHVPICEENPWECIKTDIIGTQNLINQSIAHRVKNFVAMSTDKAADPYNVYGYCKLLMEKLVCDVGQNTDAIPNGFNYFCVRPGNLIGSSGSVIHIFKDQLKNGQPLTITNPDMRRFFITLDDVVDLIFKALESAFGGEVFVPNMKAARIGDLTKVIATRYYKHFTKLADIKEIGARPGEKVHETIISKDESKNVHQIPNEYYIIDNEAKDTVSCPISYEAKDTTNAELFTPEELNILLDKMNQEEGEYLV